MSATTIQEPPAGDIGRNRWFLSHAPIVRSLIHLCVPMAAAMIVGAIYNLINAGVIGSLHITVFLAAITLGSPILGLVMAIGNVFGVGGGALISRLLGAAEHDPSAASEIKGVSAFSFWGAILAGGLIGAAGLLMLDPIVALLGAHGEAVVVRIQGFDGGEAGHAHQRLPRAHLAGAAFMREHMLEVIEEAPVLVHGLVSRCLVAMHQPFELEHLAMCIDAFLLQVHARTSVSNC